MLQLPPEFPGDPKFPPSPVHRPPPESPLLVPEGLDASSVMSPSGSPTRLPTEAAAGEPCTDDQTVCGSVTSQDSPARGTPGVSPSDFDTSPSESSERLGSQERARVPLSPITSEMPPRTHADHSTDTREEPLPDASSSSSDEEVEFGDDMQPIGYETAADVLKDKRLSR